MDRLIFHSVDLLRGLIATNADAERLRAATEQLEKNQPIIWKGDSQRKLLHLNTVYGVCESLQIAMNWLARRNKNSQSTGDKFDPAGCLVIKQEPLCDIDVAHFDQIGKKGQLKYISIKEELAEWDNLEFDSFPNDDSTEMREIECTQLPCVIKVDYDELEGEDEQRQTVLEDVHGAWSDDQESEESKRENCEDNKASTNKHRALSTIFPNKSDKKTTGRSHAKCKHCGREFTCRGTLKIHLLTHLDDEDAKRPFKCEECGKRFTQPGSLGVHKLVHLPDGDPRKKRYECNICGAILSARPALFLHKQTHLDETDPGKRRFKCEQCGKACRQQQTLKWHMRLHTGDYPFKCVLCRNKGFNTSRQLELHMEAHARGTVRLLGNTKKRTKLCTLCPKKFRKEAELAKHIKRHQDGTVGSSTEEEEDEPAKLVQKSYVCAVCGKTYNAVGSLRRHQMSHLDGLENQRPVKCSERLTVGDVLRRLQKKKQSEN